MSPSNHIDIDYTFTTKKKKTKKKHTPPSSTTPSKSSLERGCFANPLYLQDVTDCNNIQNALIKNKAKIKPNYNNNKIMADVKENGRQVNTLHPDDLSNAQDTLIYDISGALTLVTASFEGILGVIDIAEKKDFDKCLQELEYTATIIFDKLLRDDKIMKLIINKATNDGFDVQCLQREIKSAITDINAKNDIKSAINQTFCEIFNLLSRQLQAIIEVSSTLWPMERNQIWSKLKPRNDISNDDPLLVGTSKATRLEEILKQRMTHEVQMIDQYLFSFNGNLKYAKRKIINYWKKKTKFLQAKQAFIDQVQ